MQAETGQREGSALMSGFAPRQIRLPDQACKAIRRGGDSSGQEETRVLAGSKQFLVSGGFSV